MCGLKGYILYNGIDCNSNNEFKNECVFIIMAYTIIIIIIISSLKDPKVYFYALHDVHRKHSEMIQQAFRGDNGFIQSLDKVQYVYMYIEIL